MIADLEAEQDSLDQVVADLDEETWKLATDSPGWTIADQISHLQFFDERAALALNDPEAFAVDRQLLMSSPPAIRISLKNTASLITAPNIYCYGKPMNPITVKTSEVLLIGKSLHFSLMNHNLKAP